MAAYVVTNSCHNLLEFRPTRGQIFNVRRPRVVPLRAQALHVRQPRLHGLHCLTQVRDLLSTRDHLRLQLLFPVLEGHGCPSLSSLKIRVLFERHLHHLLRQSSELSCSAREQIIAFCSHSFRNLLHLGFRLVGIVSDTIREIVQPGFQALQTSGYNCLAPVLVDLIFSMLVTTAGYSRELLFEVLERHGCRCLSLLKLCVIRRQVCYQVFQLLHLSRSVSEHLFVPCRKFL
mmetsp:Transcript_57285/g.152793  ORF Transcript_57285/g.152793 Transcript_57285/m.152793 type:complete len:232 (-) Transcript_57285:314-1009(-)